MKLANLSRLLFSLLLTLPCLTPMAQSAEWFPETDMGIAKADKNPNSGTVPPAALPQAALPPASRLRLSVVIGSLPLPVITLSLDSAIALLVARNPEVARARLEWLASKDRYVSSYGTFEPALVGSMRHESLDRPSVLREQKQNLLTSGIEGTLPTATRYNASFSITDIRNRFSDNFTRPSTFAGVTVTQPLLQGLWFGRPVIEIKAAAVNRAIALHSYRSRLAGSIVRLEAEYWKLCHAHKKTEYAENSVRIAKEIVEDSRFQLRVGRISSLDETEAKAGLAARLADMADAQKELIAASNEVKLLIAGESWLRDTLLLPSTRLDAAINDTVAKPSASFEELQPDYLRKKFELKRERLALDHQADRCMPELNLKGSWGYLVSAKRSDVAWRYFQNDYYRSRSENFAAEIEFRLPLGSGIKERNLLAAERRMVDAAEVDLRGIWVQIENYLSVARRRVASAKRNLENARIVIEYRDQLLLAEIVRQKAGKSNYRKIFEIEEELTKSRLWELENLVELRTTRAEIGRLTGMVLLDCGVEILEGGVPVILE